MLVWIGLWAVLLSRWGRFVAAWGGPLDHRVAAITVVVGLACVGAWSIARMRRPPVTKGVGMSQWDLTGRAFGQNRIAALGLMAIVTFYLVALVTPLISPHDPIV